MGLVWTFELGSGESFMIDEWYGEVSLRISLHMI